jgi:molybdate transport system regulatory protein
MKELLRDDLRFRLNGRLWLEADERFMGIGRLELLAHIQALGSISKAAQAMNMSNNRAWELVSSMNAQAQKPLVSTQVGGKQGGGAEVTAEGQQMIREFEELQARFQAFLRAEEQQLKL